MTYDVDMFNDIFNDDDDIPNDDMFDENFALLGATLLTLKAEKTKATRANVLHHLTAKLPRPDQAQEIIEISLEKGKIATYRYAGEIGYRLKQSAVICDAVADASTTTVEKQPTTEPASTNTPLSDPSATSNAVITTNNTINNSAENIQDYVKHSEFQEFAANMIVEMSKLTGLNVKQQTPGPESVTAALMSHINFLQQTITALISSQNQKTFIDQTSLISNHKTPPPPPPFVLPAPKPPPAISRPYPLSVSAQPTQTVKDPAPPLQHEAAKPAKKQVLIMGDSMLNCIDEKDLRRNAFVRVRNHPGATVEDMGDHIRAHTRNTKHDAVIIMAGQNDISLNNQKENINKPKRKTADHMTKLIHQVKQSAPDAHIAIVQVTARKDKKGIMKQVIELNQELKQVVQREQVGFVSTSFYQTEHCGMKGVHPNAKGVDLLYETLDKYVRKISHE